MSLCKRAYTHGYARYAFRRERSKKRRPGCREHFSRLQSGAIRGASRRGVSPSAIISETRAKPAGVRPSLFLGISPRSTSYCLSLRFTFPRDGDVRFNKAPGMSCHVMHSIACEIYVNTAIRSRESVSPALFLPFARMSRIPGA